MNRMQKSQGIPQKLSALDRTHRSQVYYLVIVNVRSHLAVEIFLDLNNAGNKQAAAA